jgi:hypothetical protein
MATPTLASLGPYAFSALTNPNFSYAAQAWNTLGPQIYNQMMGANTQPQPAPQPNANMTAAAAARAAALQAQYNRLAGQASNALNGGLLGYQPSQIQAAGSNPQTFNAPQGNFRNSFAGLQGLLGGGH